MKIAVCTFGNYPMSKGFDRYRTEAKAMGMFDEVYTYDEKSLGKDFTRKWGRHMFPFNRGFGYWCWKPFIIRESLNKLSTGDILLYTDLGCFFNVKGIDRLNEYINLVKTSKSGMLGFRSQKVSYNGREETLRYEYEWTKGDIFDYFNVRDDKSFTNTTQFESTAIFFRKSEETMRFVDSWYNAYLEDYSLATDSPSRSPNLEGFIENRHDQSIYSILAKKYNINEFSTNEICTAHRDDSWELLVKYPIHAKRELFYTSAFHYKHRFRYKQLYQKWWSIKYFFKDIFSKK